MADEQQTPEPRPRDWAPLWYLLYFAGFFASLWLIAAFGLLG